MFLRFGVGAAEGGAEPASASMVADAFPPKQRSTALAVQKVGGLLGVAFGLPIAAWIAQTHGWRTAFVAIGLPGLFLSVMFFLVAKEPPRTTPDAKAAKQSVPTLVEALKGLWALRELRYFYLAVGANSAVTSIMQWIPTLYQRSFGLSLTQIGQVMMWVAGIGASAGMVLGASVVDRFGRQNDVWTLRFLGILVLLASPLGLLALFVSDRWISTVVLGIWLFITAGWVGPAYALSQTLVATRVRARSVAILGAFINLVGQGAGPALAGFISQRMSPYTDDSLRYGMMVVVSTGFLASAGYFAAARTKKQLSVAV